MSLAIHPADVLDREEALVASLRRPIGLGRGWGLIRTLLFSILSFGVLPLLMWPIRLRDLFAGEAARFIQVGNFVTASQAGGPGRISLLDAARRTSPRPILWVLPILCGLVSIVILGQLFLIGAVDNPADLVDWTYGASRAVGIDELANVRFVFAVWSGLLITGYVAHFINVQTHFSAVRKFLVRFNGVLQFRGVQTIALPRRTLMPNLLWLAAGAVMAGCLGAWWGVPMVIAGALQRSYCFDMHRNVRRALADRIVALSSASTVEQRCPTPRCQTLLPAGARFCPRCGSAVNPLFVAGGVVA